jgi:membrane-associated protease RseP (regulator of RpoE activity)
MRKFALQIVVGWRLKKLRIRGIPLGGLCRFENGDPTGGSPKMRKFALQIVVGWRLKKLRIRGIPLGGLCRFENGDPTGGSPKMRKFVLQIVDFIDQCKEVGHNRG